MYRVYISRLLNTCLGGSPSQMISSRLYEQKSPLQRVINFFFFWQKNHCRRASAWERLERIRKNGR